MALPLPVLDAFPSGPDPSAFSDRTTRYLKSIHPVPFQPASSGLFVLKDAGANSKLGRRLLKSRWKDCPLFALTLVERETCWAGCQNLTRCYGDNMPFAMRYRPGAALERAVATDVRTLAARKATRAGFVVRLHVLGDFYSVPYVRVWHELLAEVAALRIYGYTHWRYHSPIGRAVTDLVQAFPERAAFLRSDADEADDPLPAAMTVGKADAAIPGTVVCPEQTGRAPSCAACGLCMNGHTSVTFLDHSRVRGPAPRVATLPALV